MTRKKLGEICYVLNGFAFQSSNYVPTGIRIIRIANVQKGYIDDSSPVFYPIDTAGIEKYSLSEGDLLLSLTGNVGRVAILQKELLPAALNQRVACLRVKNNEISLKYLFYFLSCSKFENDCILASNGVAQKNLSTEWLKDYEIPIYEPREQDAIVTLLDRILDCVEKRKQQLEKLDLLVKAKFYEMFGDPIVNSRGLPTVPLSRLAFLKSGKNVTSKDIHEYTDSTPYPCFGGNGIRGYVSKFSHDGEYCLIGRQGALCGNVQFAKGKFYATEHAVVVSLSQNDNTIWIYHCLKYLNLNRLQTGAAQPGLNIDILNQVDIPRPPLELQNEFAHFVEQTEKIKTKIKRSLEKLELLKQSLLQKYFG